jgi:hypothetical protein
MSLEAGGLVLQDSTQQIDKQCLNFMYVSGPYNNADPADRLLIGDVRRRQDDANFKTYYNAIKTLAVHEAMYDAGLRDAKILLPKTQRPTTTAAVAVGSGGRYPIIAYNQNTFDKNVPFGAAVGISESTGKPLPGTVIINMNNGTALVQDDTLKRSAYVF